MDVLATVTNIFRLSALEAAKMRIWEWLGLYLYRQKNVLGCTGHCRASGVFPPY